mgnify:CR=1 FL=1
MISHLVLGGARSGKSRYAEQLALNTQKPRIYIATAQAVDDEMAQRIAHHQQQRCQNVWQLVEEPIYLADRLAALDQEYQVIFTVGEQTEEEKAQAGAGCEACIPDSRTDTVVVIANDKMGEGSEELGKTLLKAFTFALTQQDNLPKTILFYNGGASLTCEGSPMLEDLKTLEAEGVEILTCGTCLNFYGLTEKLAVGGVTNMYVIAEKMLELLEGKIKHQ